MVMRIFKFLEQAMKPKSRYRIVKNLTISMEDEVLREIYVLEEDKVGAGMMWW